MEPEIIARYKSLTTRSDKAEKAPGFIEFFFFAPSQKAASELAESLKELGCVLYEQSTSLTLIEVRQSISGHTFLIDDSIEVLTAWYETMSELAESHNCEFDGYGRPCNDFEEDPEDIS